MKSLFEDAEYSLSDYRRACDKWTEIVKDFTRAQLVQTMVDFRGLTEPAYDAANLELQQRDRNDLRRQMRQEELDAWSSMPPKEVRKLAKRHGKSAKWIDNVLAHKSKVKSAAVIADYLTAANDDLVKAAS